MTLIPTVSAVTAAYAAQAVKPANRASADGASEEPITLLSARPKEDAANMHASVAALRSPTALSLMFTGPQYRQPQGTRREAVDRYREFEKRDDRAKSPDDD